MYNKIGEFNLGTKNYDTDWFLKYDLSYTQAAKLLKSWGFSFIMTQSRFLPMADSAVPSEITPAMEERYASYDDQKFREALGKEGISYWPTLCTFFNPPGLEEDLTLRPIDASGSPMRMIDWYVGVSPSHEAYVTRQVEAVTKIVEKLEPEGIFLSFIRWPGFWELWMPHHSRTDFPEYNYDENSLKRFTLETGLQLPSMDPIEASTWIETNARETWTTWKCGIITDVVRQVGEGAKAVKPDTQIMINTLPFGGTEYDTARDKTFGQSLDSLSEVVDIFEVMTYHQILKRPVDWIPAIGQEVKQRTGKKTLCTLQAEPLYLDGMHKIEGRKTTIDKEEFTQAVNAVESANLDGVVVFVWSDLLKNAFVDKDLSRIEALQSAVQRRNQKINRP
jgi:hypothetical protein